MTEVDLEENQDSEQPDSDSENEKDEIEYKTKFPEATTGTSGSELNFAPGEGEKY